MTLKRKLVCVSKFLWESANGKAFQMRRNVVSVIIAFILSFSPRLFLPVSFPLPPVGTIKELSQQ